MVFSSIPFIFFFLPVFLIIYYIVPFRWKNFILLLFSLIFYAWGEPIYIGLMIFSSVFDYINGQLLKKTSNKRKRKIILTLSIIGNLALLSIFKYSDFLISNINYLFKLNISLLELPLPIGISFFTFQTMSYTIDVYRGKVPPEDNFFDFMTYVSMFPQLIAGPIVRYEDVHLELKERKISFDNFAQGIVCFLEGLFKKVLIANVMGELFLEISTNYATYSALSLWLGIIAFTFQIYFDFSGYSDMAIGIGKMIGFTYPENFDYPYTSKSITEFWRRWHMSLSYFFRDYVYIPLGGSKTGVIKNIRNILIVWLLTGLWHGSSWNFVLWGIYFGVILLIEKFVLKGLIEKLPNFLKHIYTLILIVIGFGIFAFDDMTMILSYAKGLLGMGNNFIGHDFIFFIINYLFVFIAAIVFSMPTYRMFKEYINKKGKGGYYTILLIVYLLLFMITTAYLVSDTYNPFLYFRF